MILSHHQRLQPHWSLQCDRYKSIDIEISISISIILRLSIDIGIDDTFKAGIDIEYRRYFWKISITTLLVAPGMHLSWFHSIQLPICLAPVVSPWPCSFPNHLVSTDSAFYLFALHLALAASRSYPQNLDFFSSIQLSAPVTALILFAITSSLLSTSLSDS